MLFRPIRAILSLCFGFLAAAACARGEAAATLRSGAFLHDSPSFDVRRSAAFRKEMQLWDSSGGPGDPTTGKLDWGPFTTGRALELLVAGYPTSPAVSLRLVSGRDSLLLQATCDPAGFWTRMRWDLPPAWAGRSCHLVAEDNAPDVGGDWIGISSPLPSDSQFGKAATGVLLQLLVFLLLLAPGYAVVSCLPEPATARALVILLLASAATAFAVFFAWFLNPVAGQACSWSVLVAALAALVLRRRSFCQLLFRPDFLVPNLLAGAAAVLYFSGGYRFGGIESPEYLALSRFLPNMPTDPLLPHWFARILANGEPLHPFASDWLTSDRPPLQTGLELFARPFVSERQGYQVVGIAAQSWIWIGLWAFLNPLLVNRRALTCVIGAAVFSGMFFLNSVYCWPKLLPAAFLAMAAGLLFTGERHRTPTTTDAALAGACAAFAMLGHGGSAFGLAGIGLVYLLDRRPISPRFVGTVIAPVIILMTPWLLYQKRIDPPGDRLIKFHLAGREQIDPRPALPVIREAYANLTWRQIAANKLTNGLMLFSNLKAEPFPALAEWASSRTTLSPWAADGRLRNGLRSAQFRYCLQCPGVFLLGLLGLGWAALKRQKSATLSAAMLSLRLFAASCVVWCLLMFGPWATSIHQGSYFTEVCLFVAAGIGLALLPTACLFAVAAPGIVAFFWLWMTGPIGTLPEALMPGPFSGFTIWVALSAIGITSLLIWYAQFRPIRDT